MALKINKNLIFLYQAKEGLNIGQTCEKIGISRQAFYNIKVCGEASPVTAHKIATAFSIPVEELIVRSEE